MTGWNTDSVIDLLLECAEIARRIKSDPEIEIKDDRTPVSNADKGIEELVLFDDQVGKRGTNGRAEGLVPSALLGLYRPSV